MPRNINPIEKILGEQGCLAGFLDNFEYRPSQVEMALHIEKALIKEKSAIIEAGTGTGKTLGYLVPLFLSGKKTVISTGTKNLQEQIFFKDIPLLASATGRKIHAMIMKGRRNYLCLHRYQQYFIQTTMIDSEKELNRQRLEAWLKKTDYADRSELHWLADDDPLWDSLSATSEQCLGYECIQFEDCFLNRLRRNAAKAQIIVVNHHLFFADLMVKKGGFGEIIPRFQVAVFDEAHKLEEIATGYFGETVSTGQLSDLVTETEKEVKLIGSHNKNDLISILNNIRKGTERLKKAFDESEDRGRLNEKTRAEIRNGPLQEIDQGLNYIRQRSGLSEYKDASFQILATRAADLEESLKRIFSYDDPDYLDWYEKRKRGVIFHASPLDISGTMKELLYERLKTMVFTSATLATNNSFGYIRSRLGLPDNSLEFILKSHFDFARQSLLYVPKDMPLPNTPGFPLKISLRIIEILNITSGRALCLFTSYNNLNIVYEQVKGKIPFRIFKQGNAPRSLLLEKFRKDTHSILFATGSFWQGVDVPGESLSCLIIDKLPFESPSDPLVSARIESIEANNGNPFMEYQLPSAIISLKQGLGRLIRKSTDRGILSVMDARIIKSRYGRFFLDSLPEIPLVHELDQIQNFFKSK